MGKSLINGVNFPRGRCTWKHFVESTDVHGINQIDSSQNRATKSAWVILISLAVIFMVANLVESTIEFVNNPTLTTYSLSSTKSIPFPKLYICPMHSVNNTKISKNNYTIGVKSKMFRDYLRPLQAQPEEVNGTEAEMSTLDKVLRRKTTGASAVLSGIHPSPAFGFQRNLVASDNKTYENETVREFFLRVGYDLHEFMKECSFAERSFDCSSIATAVYDQDYGKCFIINIGDKSQFAPGMGLSVLLDIHDEEYSMQPNESSLFAGVSIFIGHSLDPTSLQRTFLKPGEYSKINLVSKKFQLTNVSIGSTHENCAGPGRRLEVMNVSYTQSACYLDCYQQGVVRECGCVIPYDDMFLNSKYRSIGLCPASSKGNCTKSVIYAKNANEEAKKAIEQCLSTCHHPCEFIEYSVAVTSVVFPSSPYVRSMPPAPPPQYVYYEQQSEPFQPAITGDSNATTVSPNHTENATVTDPDGIDNTTANISTSDDIKENSTNSSNISGSSETGAVISPYIGGDTWVMRPVGYTDPRADAWTWPNNFILVDIAFDSMQLQIIKQSPSMTYNMFISNIGGQLGLWIGASLFTVIQLVVFVVSFISRKCQRGTIDHDNLV